MLQQNSNCNCNCNDNISDAPPTSRLTAHYVVKTQERPTEAFVTGERWS